MTRRARIVLASAGALFVLFALAVAGIVAVTQTSWGRAQVRQVIVTLLRGKIHGSLYVGHITDGFFTGVTIDSLAIRDSDDSLFFATGPVTVQYDVRDLMDRRILLRGVRAEHPVVYIRQHEDGDWNFRRVFPSGPPVKATHAPGFGDYVVIESGVVRNATFLLTLPWHPSPTLRGAALDSAVRFELIRKDHEIRRTGEGKHTFARTWRWTNIDAQLLRGRIADPDSAGKLFRVANFRVNEADPPFLFRNATATLRQLGDSIWVDVPHFDLPGSTGNGEGKIVWGSNLPIRYALHITGDSVSMSDVAWVYPTLPRTGGGRTKLDIITDPKNLHLTNYVLHEMDMHSTRSHLTGRMTFTLGTDTLIVRDVQLAGSPVNFDLLRTLNGKPFPYDWQGDITGTVRASGGNLTRFKVEDAQFTFADAHVPGAITRGTANGELNILFPAFTEFHGFNVNVSQLDLRTLQYLNKEFPRLNGIVFGTATLDSSWLDVRFRNADLMHQDGPGPVSHVTGNGRVTWGEKYLTYDLDLTAQPVSFTTLSRSYPLLPLRGSFTGPIKVQGQSPDLLVSTSLSGPGGTLTYDGHVDADPLVYAAHGTGTFTHLDLRTLLENPQAPEAVLNGTYVVDITGDTLPRTTGTISLALQPSTYGRVQILPSAANLRIENGLVNIDTLRIRTSVADMDARGSVALTNGRTGTLSFTATIDSLARLNQLFATPISTPIGGRATVTGTIAGSTPALTLNGAVQAQNLFYGSARARHATGKIALDAVTPAPVGTLTLTADSVSAGLFPLDTLSAALRLIDAHSATFRTSFVGRGAVGGVAVGAAGWNDAATTVRVDTMQVSIDTVNRYHLEAPTHIVHDTRGATASTSIDSLRFTRNGGGAVTLRDLRLAGDSVHGSLRTNGLDLSILTLFGSAITNVHGAFAANVDVAGTLARPQLNGAVTIDNGAGMVPAAGMRLDRVNADIRLDGDTVRVQRLDAETNRERRGRMSITGTVALHQYDNPVFALSATAQNFRVVDKRGLASLDISTSQPMTITGPFQAAVMRGGIRVERGSIYIPELITKRVVSLSDPELYDVIDTTVAQNRALMPAPPSAFAKNLRLENVGVNIGDDVWLRSAEANIKLGGSLTVTMGNSPRTGEPAQLALEGTLNAVRGTYRLNVVPLVQPVFDVEQGTLRFYGTPDLNPTLNITAINTVRKPQESINRQDVRIRATIGGTLAAPTLTLSSADNLPLTQSDLLSYLITGEPAFALDYTTRQYVDQLAAVAIRSAGSVISSAIPRSVFDVVELQTPGLANGADAQTRLNNPTLYNLLNTRAVLGKQLNNNLFLNFSTGFCAENFRNNIGLRLEYRFNRTYTALFGIEPGSSDLVCARTGATQSVQQTPPQVGLDFYRAWRF